MNRSNVGNVVTNATQTMAVSGFTSAGYMQNQRRARLADAASALNNLSEDEVRQLGQYKAEQTRQQIREGENVTSGVARLSDAEQQKLGEKRAEDLRIYINEEPEDVDEVMADSVYDTLKSPQQKELKLNAEKNLGWLADYKKGLSQPNPVDEIIEEHKKTIRGDKDANG